MSFIYESMIDTDQLFITVIYKINTRRRALLYYIYLAFKTSVPAVDKFRISIPFSIDCR